MSLPHIPDPMPGDAAAADAIEMVIVPRARDLGEVLLEGVVHDLDGPGADAAGAGHRRASAPAYRAFHRHLAVRRLDLPP